MNAQPTVLAVLLEAKGLDRYGTFRAAYDKAARALDRQHGSAPPSRAQFHRWLTGGLRRLPHTDHCLVLEQILTGYTTQQLFELCPANGTPVPRTAETAIPAGNGSPAAAQGDLADVAGVFASRSDFASSIQPQALFDGAARIRAAGLSLNLICQQLPDTHLLRLLRSGTQLTCLLLDPDGAAIKAREQEEGYPPGHLSTLNALNVGLLTRLRARLPDDQRDRLRIALYDETIRFNIILVDDSACVVQPYMPQARGVDSPTLLIRRNNQPGGLYPVFEQVYESIQERSKPL
jgi:Domain of unknown function (DUF5919)